MQRCVDWLRAGSMARLLHGGGQVGFFDYRFAPDRLHWTPSLCSLLGIDTPPPGGLSQWYARIDEADRVRIERELWTACALRRPDETLDYAVRLPDGGSRLLTTRIMLGYAADGRPVRMTGLTVVATRQRSAMIARQGKDELLAMLGHQLRTPLGALSAANEVLQLVDPGSNDAREALTVIARQTARLSQLLHDLAGSAAGSPAIRPSADAPPAVLPLAQRKKVLVVEDNDDVLASLCARLELEGHEVTAARDGIEGLCRLRVQTPEVSIVDIGLPRLTGLDLARHARAGGYSGRIVALTGIDVGQEAQAVHSPVFDDWLLKPVEPHRLRASLRAS